MPRRAHIHRFVPRTTGAKLGSGMVITRSELGNALRTYRIRVGLSQRQVGKALKCSQARLGSLERGETRNLTERDLRCLSLLFRIRADRLRRLIPPPAPLLPPLTPLAKLLRARRDALGLSRVELARRAGTSPMHLGTLERSASGIRYSMMLRLTKALDLDPRVLEPFVASFAGNPVSALGSAVRRRRKDLCLSAESVGRLAGVSKTTVLAVEAGRVNLGRDGDDGGRLPGARTHQATMVASTPGPRRGHGARRHLHD